MEKCFVQEAKYEDIRNFSGYFFLIAITSYCLGIYQNQDILSDDQIKKEEAARAIAADFTDPEWRSEFFADLMDKDTKNFNGGSFSCIKFNNPPLSYGYNHVACKFDDGHVEVTSF